MSHTIDNSNISFSDIDQTYDDAFIGTNESTWPPDPISLTKFRNKPFTSGDTIPSSGVLSINNHFKGREFQEPYITRMSNSTLSPIGANSLYPGIVNAYWRRYIIKINYSKDLFTIRNGQYITGIRFYISDAVTSSFSPYPNYQIAMKNSSDPISTNPGTTGWTVVRTAADLVSTITGYKYISFDTNFQYTGNNLSISFAWGQIPTGFRENGKTYVLSNSESSNKAKLFYDRTDDSGTYTFADDAPTLDNGANPIIPVIDFFTDAYPITRLISTSTQSHPYSRGGIINTYQERYLIKFNYSASLLSSIGINNGNEIVGIEFYVSQKPSNTLSNFPDYQIAIKNSSGSVSTNPETSGWSVIRSASNLNVGSTGWYTTNIFQPTWSIKEKFIYTGGTLSFSFGWGNIGGSDQNGALTYTFNGDSTTAYIWDEYGQAGQAGTFTYSNNAYPPQGTPTPNPSHFIPLLKIYKGHT
mgnify:CR=1 FL=1